jgi:hypothetical protein
LARIWEWHWGFGVFLPFTGTPITGDMINSYGSYHPAIIFAWVATLVGVATIFGARAVLLQVSSLRKRGLEAIY